MGLSATQARFLQLTSRKSDYEYQAQQINHSRLKIAQELSDIATNYTNAMNNRNLSFISFSGDGSQMNTTALDYNTITAEVPNGLGYRLTDRNGTEIHPQDKNAQTIREQAQEKYANAMEEANEFCYKLAGNGVIIETKPINGDNLLSFYSNANITDKDGNAVDKEAFQKSIAGMNSTDFYQYWQQEGYQGIDFHGTQKNQAKVIAADIELQKALDEADRIENTACIYDDRCLDAEYLEEQLRSGEWALHQPTQNFDEAGNQIWEEINYSAVGQIKDSLDTSDDAKAQAEYDAKTDYFQQKDKELELQLKQIETAHTSIETEIDSLSKVIEQNVERSFKTFG